LSSYVVQNLWLVVVPVVVIAEALCLKLQPALLCYHPEFVVVAFVLVVWQFEFPGGFSGLVQKL